MVKLWVLMIVLATSPSGINDKIEQTDLMTKQACVAARMQLLYTTRTPNIRPLRNVRDAFCINTETGAISR